MLCKQCQYPLKGLTEHRCPECAHPFDPNDPSTFEPDVLVGVPPRHLLYIAVIVYAVCLLARAFVLDGPGSIAPAANGFLPHIKWIDAIKIGIDAGLIAVLVLPFVFIPYLIFVMSRERRSRG